MVSHIPKIKRGGAEDQKAGPGAIRDIFESEDFPLTGDRPAAEKPEEADGHKASEDGSGK